MSWNWIFEAGMVSIVWLIVLAALRGRLARLKTDLLLVEGELSSMQRELTQNTRELDFHTRFLRDRLLWQSTVDLSDGARAPRGPQLIGDDRLSLRPASEVRAAEEEVVARRARQAAQERGLPQDDRRLLRLAVRNDADVVDGSGADDVGRRAGA